MSPIRVIGKAEVQEALEIGRCIRLMHDTLAEMARGGLEQPLRLALQADGKKLLGLMPAFSQSCGLLGAKILTVFPDNFKRGIPSHQGAVLLFDWDTGALKALVDAEAVTEIRTAAVSAAATDVLARRDAHTLALFGAGVQARSHLRAISSIRDIRRVLVWDYYPQAAERFQKEMQRETGLPITVCLLGEDAASEADVICTVTASRVPVLFGDWVGPGTHINAVGACRPADRELDTALVKSSSFFVDSRLSAVNEAGDFLIPLAQGEITEGHIRGEIGEVFAGLTPGRTARAEVTVFEALGLAAEDLAAADHVWRVAVAGR